MRVSAQVQERKTAHSNPRYELITSVAFSAAEIAAIKRHHLINVVVFDGAVRLDVNGSIIDNSIKVRDLLMAEPLTSSFASLLQANACLIQLRRALKNLETVIENRRRATETPQMHR